MERVEGKHVTVILDGKKCVHSRNCVLSHPEVFVPGVKAERPFPRCRRCDHSANRPCCDDSHKAVGFVTD